MAQSCKQPTKIAVGYSDGVIFIYDLASKKGTEVPGEIRITSLAFDPLVRSLMLCSDFALTCLGPSLMLLPVALGIGCQQHLRTCRSALHQHMSLILFVLLCLHCQSNDYLLVAYWNGFTKLLMANEGGQDAPGTAFSKQPTGHRTVAFIDTMPGTFVSVSDRSGAGIASPLPDYLTFSE